MNRRYTLVKPAMPRLDDEAVITLALDDWRTVLAGGTSPLPRRGRPGGVAKIDARCRSNSPKASPRASSVTWH